ncbi:MAG: prepilin-type N-terminal cleavage/methylation domain-containing protein [Verrucomicrobia bacterium]|nr:prepilin-type N-terminal cleavage/methylation domain-containing protein [Verrucomicrobiota bacterium]
MKHASDRKKGFTLVEMMMALVISTVVFAAMGVLLGKTFSLWMDGAGHWYLANQARAARARILSGPMGAGTGVLSIDGIKSIKTNPNWCTLEYAVASSGEKYWMKGSVENPASKDRSIFFKNNHGGGQTWLMLVGRKRGNHDEPDVKTESFNATLTDKVLSLSYDLKFQTGGRTYERAQRIRAYLVNE